MLLLDRVSLRLSNKELFSLFPVVNSRENVVAGFYRAKKKKFSAATAAPTLHSWLVSAASRVSATFKNKKKGTKCFRKCCLQFLPKPPTSEARTVLSMSSPSAPAPN